MKTTLQRLVALAFAIQLSGCTGTTAPQPDATKIEAEIEGKLLTIALQNWPRAAKVQGGLFADEITTIAAKVPGRVVEVNCDLGDLVQADQTLVKLDQREYELLAAQAEAQLTQARAAIGLKPGDDVEKLNPLNAPPVREAKAVLDEAKQSVERLKTLYSQGAVVATDLEAATALETVADARFNSSLNSVREKIALVGVQTALRALAEQRLSDTLITAPFKGRIQNRTVAVGSYVNVGQPILELVRTDVLRYRASVPERFASQVKLGQKVRLLLHDQAPREITVTRISPALDAVSRSLMFEAEVPNDDNALRSGSFAQADIILDEQSQAITIPVSAMVRFAGVQKVWKVVDGKVKEVVVEVGEEKDNLIEIRTGLQVGDMVLIDGRNGSVGTYKGSGETLASPAPSTEDPVPVSASPKPVFETAPKEAPKSTTSQSTRTIGVQTCIG
ncbi:MAG: efflux RND transporter periplasmic adaptor subunit [Pirellulaceae bacterium]|nr:efflux RND transporter periplasmic adaptor subunit [Pirellulaceae bacterium]